MNVTIEVPTLWLVLPPFVVLWVMWVLAVRSAFNWLKDLSLPDRRDGSE